MKYKVDNSSMESHTGSISHCRLTKKEGNDGGHRDTKKKRWDREKAEAAKIKRTKDKKTIKEDRRL